MPNSASAQEKVAVSPGLMVPGRVQFGSPGVVGEDVGETVTGPHEPCGMHSKNSVSVNGVLLTSAYTEPERCSIPHIGPWCDADGAVPLVRELLEDGNAQLVPIAGGGRTSLLKQSHNLLAVSIPAGLYPRTGKVDTVGLRAIFIVNAAVPDSSVYGILQALFNPENRATLAGSHRSAQAIRIDDAARDLPAPLHPGALHFYRDSGHLPKR